MLALTRKKGEVIVLTYPDKTRVEVVVTESKKGQVVLGFAAPRDVLIERLEVEARRLAGTPK